MIKKLLVLSMTSLIAISSAACSLSSSSVSDAEQRVEAYNKNEKTTKPAMPEELKTAFEGETVKRSADKAEDGTQIPIAKMNEKVTYNNVDITVENAWKGNDLTLLEELEGDSVFKDFLIREMNYGGDSEIAYDENGKYLKGNRKYIFLKVKIASHNDGTSDMGMLDMEIGMNPYFYKSTDEKNFNFSHIDSCGFDKYKEITDTTKQVHLRRSTYVFEKDEELETIIVCNYLGDISLDNLYMSVRFVSWKGLGPTADIPSGCPMIKIEFDN